MRKTEYLSSEILHTAEFEIDLGIKDTIITENLARQLGIKLGDWVHTFIAGKPHSFYRSFIWINILSDYEKIPCRIFEHNPDSSVGGANILGFGKYQEKYSMSISAESIRIFYQ